MILTTVLIVVIAAIAFLKREELSPGSAVLGFVLAFLLLGSVVGPYLQDGMAYLGNVAETAITAGWHEVTK